MSFVDNFLDMCNARGETPSHALQASGLSKAFLSKLKKYPDRAPNSESVQKIALYFGCTADDLLYDGPINKRTRTAIKIQSLVDKLPEDQQEYLLRFIRFNWSELK